MRNCCVAPAVNTAVANEDREHCREKQRKERKIQREYEKCLRELEHEGQNTEGKTHK